MVPLFLLLWFCLALIAGATGMLRQFSAPEIAVTVWGLTIVVLFACWRVSPLQAWCRAVDLRWLLGIHLCRFVGIYFLVLAGRGQLPLGFARPAGVGDIIAAAFALLFLIWHRLGENRRLVLVWNVFGLADIFFVVASALRFGLRDWQSMHALRALPLSLLPTLIVPLIIASHVIMLVRLSIDRRQLPGAD